MIDVRSMQLRAHIDAGNFVKPIRIEDLAEAGKTLLEPKNFEPGDVVTIAKKPFGVRFAVGTVAVVISQNVNDIPVAQNEDSPLSCSALGDTLVALPEVTDVGFVVFQIHSSVLAPASELDIAAANEHHGAKFDELMAATNPPKPEEN